MIIRLDGVTKEYGGHRALSDLTAEVRPGAIGLLGPNGAGKSTLIKTLLGLVRLTSGSASVLDLDVREDAIKIRERVGYMPEDDCYVAGLRGVEMVAHTAELAGLPHRTALRRAHEILDYVRLGDSRYREVQTYSTGMKQRVRLAVALVHSPKLVFLDEPTSGLDPDGREQMLALVRDLANNKGVSVVISTHILHDVEVCCDSVLMLGKGKLLVYEDLATLQQSTDDSIEVRVNGRPEVEALQARLGAQVRGTEGRDRLRVAGGDGGQRALLEAARDSGISLREVSPSKTSLESIFLRALRGDDADS